MLSSTPEAPAGAADATDVILRDGSTLRLRAPAHEDAGALLAFFGALSERSRYLRFHGSPRLDRALVESYLDPDWLERGALVGMLDDRIVALGNYVRLRDRTGAEAAFVVADELQGHGVGTRLLEQLAARAAAEGIERFVAEVMAANVQMLSVFTNAGFEVARELESGEIEVRFPIAATNGFRARVDERDHLGVVASLRPFFEPESVAVIGASRRRGSIGGELFRNMLDADFAGSVYPVNRKAEPVAGVHAYHSVGEIGRPVDLAVVCVPGGQVVDAAQSALRAGVRALCVISSGFAEMGAGGRALQEQLLAAVRAHGGRLVGPNCLGVAAPVIGLNATFAPRALPPGRIALSSQSGALGLALLEKAAERNLGFSSFVSIGNKADVSSNDLLEWWEEDEGSDVVLLYLESFGNPRKFGRLARRVARRKPVLALKAGTTGAGARAAGSHTAALAGSDVAIDALFRDAGVLRPRSLEELVDAAALFSSQPLPSGRRVGVVTNAGGLGILCADACESSGLELPALSEQTREALAGHLPLEASVANPVDLLGSATAATYEAVLPLLLADPHVDALIVLFVPPAVAGADDVAGAIHRAVASAATEKPVLAVVMSADGTPAALLGPGSPVATFPYPESAARALGLAAERADWLRRPAGSVPALEDVDVEAARRVVTAALAGASEAWLRPQETRAVLEAFGLPLVPERVATTAEGAVEAARQLGFPVVVKSSAAGAHKTESGGVALDLGDAEAVRAAVERIGAPVVVQPQIEGGAELLAGVVQDPVFGPLVAFGPGGVLTELIGGAGIRTAPLTDVDAEELVREGKAGILVAGFRGAPPADASALVDLVHRLGRLAEDLPEVVELDLNPVIAREDGCLAVDARVRVKVPPVSRSVKGW
ncbi:MAG: GNAT family N-acetyltransferase [Acidobacteriota bacterium]|nr:GNAT family N-acetyltransferase [Acidobacteriota bacterium]